MSDGTLSVRRRDVKEKSDPRSQLDSLSDIHFGQTNMSPRDKSYGVEELRLHTPTSKRLKEHDKLLKNFRYSAALDSVLKRVGDL